MSGLNALLGYPAAANRLHSTRPGVPPAAEEFRQVLEALSSASDSGFAAPLTGQEAESHWLSASGLSGETSLIEPLMALVVLQALERLAAADTKPDMERAVPQGLPLDGRVSQGYHAAHHGLDLAVPVGTPVAATMAGTVTHAGWNDQGYGNLVIVENGPYKTYYAHLDSIPVNPGQRVWAGEVIGLSGNTGNSTGPHLHYEVRVNNTQVPASMP